VCHNPDFSGREPMPRLANQREEYLLKAMQDYRSGNRIGRDVNARLAGGTAVHPRHHVFPLDRLADAHVAVEEGAVGKVVVRIGA